MNRPGLQNAGDILIRAVNSMTDGFVLFDADDRIILCNEIYARMLEGFGNSTFDASTMVGMHVEEIIRKQVESGQSIPPDTAATSTAGSPIASSCTSAPTAFRTSSS